MKRLQSQRKTWGSSVPLCSQKSYWKPVSTEDFNAKKSYGSCLMISNRRQTTSANTWQHQLARLCTQTQRCCSGRTSAPAFLKRTVRKENACTRLAKGPLQSATFTTKIGKEWWHRWFHHSTDSMFERLACTVPRAQRHVGHAACSCRSPYTTGPLHSLTLAPP